MDLPKKFLHRIDILAVGSVDQYGDRTMASTAIFSQQCFITGTQKRIVDARGEVWQTGFSVMLLPNINTIGIDFLVSNGVNKYGVTLIDSGRVVSVEKIDHPRRGLQFFDVWVIKGE